VTIAGRDLDWDGCFNVRDLGGLPAAGGRTTRGRAVVRADALDGLTAAGWTALVEHGVRTVIDLRNDDEVGEDAAPRPADVATVRIPLDVSEDREFWSVWRDGPQFGTPLYFRPHLDRFPHRSAAVVAAVARAGPGGVAFHCAGGRDRAGQVTMLLLALVGVPAEAIAADYAVSFERLPARYAARGEEDQGPLLRSYLQEQGTSAEALIVDLLDGLDVEARLGRAGLGAEDVAALRRRLGEHVSPTAAGDDLARRIRERARLRGEFRLRSGAVSGEYFDKYRFESDPELLRAVAERLTSLLVPEADAVAGLELGGVPLATMVSQLSGLPALFVRKAAKDYGTSRLVEGGDVAGRRLVVVEDVVTSGGQLVESCAALRELGADIVRVLCVIDREAGGAVNLAAHGLELRSVFTMSGLEAAARGA